MLTPGGRPQRITRRAGAIAVIAAAVFAAGAAEARAECGPDSDPAICQYVEDIPTSEGSHASGGGGSSSGAGGSTSGGGGQTASTLSPSVTEDVEAKGGKDTKRLKAIATSPAYGAPTNRANLEGAGSEQRPADTSASLDSGSALSAAASAVGSGEGTLLGLITALVLISFATLALAARRAAPQWRRRAK
jgi:hypothetical protein